MKSVSKRLVAAAFCLFPALASANAGVPMLALAWPVQWLTLLPIVVLEAWYLSRAFGFPFRTMFAGVGKANLLSTLIGIPIAWSVMFALEMFIGMGMSALAVKQLPEWANFLLFPFMAAWVVGSSVWQVYAAFLVLTVPFCWVSIVIENKYLSGFLPIIGGRSLRRAVTKANIASYVFLSAVALAFPLFS